VGTAQLFPQLLPFQTRTSPRSATRESELMREQHTCRDGGFREKACSTESSQRPRRAQPARENSRRGPQNRERFKRAYPRSERRYQPISKGQLREAVGTVELPWNLQMGAVRLTHLERTLLQCVKSPKWCGHAGRFGFPGGRVKMFDKIWFSRSWRQRLADDSAA